MAYRFDERAEHALAVFHLAAQPLYHLRQVLDGLAAHLLCQRIGDGFQVSFVHLLRDGDQNILDKAAVRDKHRQRAAPRHGDQADLLVADVPGLRRQHHRHIIGGFGKHAGGGGDDIIHMPQRGLQIAADLFRFLTA